MPDINFVDNKPKEAFPPNNGRGPGNLNVKWSEPDTPDRMPNKKRPESTPPKRMSDEQANSRLHSQIIAGKDEKENAEKIKKSRQEVLDMIKKEKKEKQLKRGNESFLSRFFSSRNNGNKNNKEKIAEHHEAKKAEKKEKAEPPAPREKDESPIDAYSANDYLSGSSRIIETNLVNRVEDIEFNWRSYYIFLIAGSFLSIVLIGLIYIWILSEGREAMARIEPINAEIEKSIFKINGLTEAAKEVNAFNEKLSLAKKMLESHVYWTNLFDILEEYTLTDVAYSGGFSAEIDGEFILSGVTGNYSAVTDQLRAMQSENKYIKEVFVGEASRNMSNQSGTSTPVVNFDISFLFDQSIFYK